MYTHNRVRQSNLTGHCFGKTPVITVDYVVRYTLIFICTWLRLPIFYRNDVWEHHIFHSLFSLRFEKAVLITRRLGWNSDSTMRARNDWIVFLCSLLFMIACVSSWLGPLRRRRRGGRRLFSDTDYQELKPLSANTQTPWVFVSRSTPNLTDLPVYIFNTDQIVR